MMIARGETFHSLMKLHQLRYFVAALEEGSFTAAAQRENATQSGLSMQIKELEERLGVRLFDRNTAGVVPTVAGRRLYQRATGILREVHDASAEIAGIGRAVSGTVHVGLMPTFTRSALTPALIAFTQAYPHVNITVTEAYSGVLAQEVARQALDFAIVPPGHAVPGIESRYLATDREFLVTRAGTGRQHLSPVALARLGEPLTLIVPGQANARRARIEAYLEACGVKLADMMEMDSMMGTLDIVANSDWSMIASGVLAAADLDGRERTLHPLAEPALSVDYVLIEPGASTLSAAAQLFADSLVGEIGELIGRIRQHVDRP